MSLDINQLTARFREGFDTSSNQVLTLNKPAVTVDRSRPWCRFSVSPGERRRVENGVTPNYLQLGGVFLRVFVPKALGVSAGDDLLDKWDRLMTDWRSADGALQIGRMTRTTEEKPDHYEITVRFAYQSLRKRT